MQKKRNTAEYKPEAGQAFLKKVPKQNLIH